MKPIEQILLAAVICGEHAGCAGCSYLEWYSYLEAHRCMGPWCGRCPRRRRQACIAATYIRRCVWCRGAGQVPPRRPSDPRSLWPLWFTDGRFQW